MLAFETVEEACPFAVSVIAVGNANPVNVVLKTAFVLIVCLLD